MVAGHKNFDYDSSVTVTPEPLVHFQCVKKLALYRCFNAFRHYNFSYLIFGSIQHSTPCTLKHFPPLPVTLMPRRERYCNPIVVQVDLVWNTCGVVWLEFSKNTLFVCNVFPTLSIRKTGFCHLDICVLRLQNILIVVKLLANLKSNLNLKIMEIYFFSFINVFVIQVV